MTGETRRAVVVGAGIVGVCTGIELRRRGFEVQVVDRAAPGEACSFGNAGVLGVQSCVPFAIPGILGDVPRMLIDRRGPLALRREGILRTLPWVVKFLRSAYDGSVAERGASMKALNGTTLELHQRLAREAGVPELIVETNYLYCYRRPEDVDIENGLAWRLRREHGARIEVFDGAAIGEVEPDLGPRYRRAVRVGPIGHATNPFRLTEAYAGLLRRMGGATLRAEVVRLVPGERTTSVATDQGALEAEVVVVAAGSWSLKLIEPLGITFPLIAERGYHVTFAEPGIRLSNVCNEAARHVAVSSMEMGLRIAGTAELGDPDAPADWRRADVLAELVREMFPRADLQRPSRWMGPRPGTPDSLPVIGPLPGHPGIMVATGHGHLGLTGGPMTGRIIAALASGERINMPLAPFAVDRFLGRNAARRASA
jgi:D-amino-acid dehydrogenase